MNILKWIDKNFEDVLCGFLLVSIMSMLMAQVMVRFLFGHGLTVSEELSRFMFLYLVYFASSLVALKGAHIRVTAHTKFLPRGMQLFLLLCSDLLWLGFNAVIIYQGFKLIGSMATKPMLSGAMLLDMRYVFVAVPVAFSLQSFRIAQRWVRHLLGCIDILGSANQ
ncbi:MAG: TRAP transporter small permease [Mailhella sp.]|nr:TRAP transporter small permease [Mailhella sp.]